MNQSMIHKLFGAMMISAALILSGCSNLGVKPWERDILAQPEMEMTADGQDLAFDEHIYFSKEASSGGQGFAGGGCGCT
jgi:hypothetical protein